MSVLYIGSVWPEIRSSAAGLRTLNLVQVAKRLSERVVFWSTSKRNEFSEELSLSGVDVESVPLNSSTVDEKLKELRPEWVFYDRFIVEEQFGWRVQENCPDAVQIMDTQDLHFLRKARQKLADKEPQHRYLKGLSVPFEESDVCREVGSILRCDLSLVASSEEMRLLIDILGVPSDRLQLFRFSYPSLETNPTFAERRGFVTIGNFRHAPNRDSLESLLMIWPCIRDATQSECYVYGAYPPKEWMDRKLPKGLRMVGECADQFQTISEHRVLLAPLRFGAGIKGKISDAFFCGTPVVTTPIGAEGMASGCFPGRVCETEDEFVQSSIDMYRDEGCWQRHQKRGYETIERDYDLMDNEEMLLGKFRNLRSQLADIRRENLIGRVLKHDLVRSTKYLSKWIEEKNREQLRR